MSAPRRRLRLGAPFVVAAVAVACSYAFVGWAGHTCAVLDDGSVWCWGYNSRGQLGDGTVYDRPRPVQVQGLPAAVSVASGLGFTCAATTDGRVYCWGRNDYGQLGVAASGDLPVPVEVLGLSGVTALAASERAACAVGSGGVSCWGRHAGGDYGGVTAIAGLPAAAVKVVVDYQVACALLAASGEVWCWGPRAAPVSEGVSGALDVALYHSSVCTLQPGGMVSCDDTLAAEAVALAARNGDLCALLSGGSVECLGAVGVVTPPASATAISVGDGWVCAVLSDGTVACWGDNWGGQLGDGTNRKRQQPVVVAGLPGSVRAVSASPALRVSHEGCGQAEYPDESQ